MVDALPIFARHGYSRAQALTLPSWEFWAFLKAVKRKEAEDRLAMIEAVAVGTGSLKKEVAEKVVNNLVKAAQITPPKPKRLEGDDFLRAFDAAMLGLGVDE